MRSTHCARGFGHRGFGRVGGVRFNDIVELARMFDATSHVGLGGVGCNDIVELAGMFDATSHVGLGGVGWGVMTSLNLHACLMLRHTWGWVGPGV